MRVLKFGGACLDAQRRLARLVHIVAQTPRPCALVVSAVGGVTDLLHQVVEHISDRAAARTAIEKLTAVHRSLYPEGVNLEAPMREILEGLEWVLARGRRTGVTPPVHDHIVSTGERMAAVLVAAHLHRAGVEAKALNSEEAGIRCDARFGEATIDLQAWQQTAATSILPLLARGVVPVVTGYYGITPAGDVATLGRSGTDYSATALGNVLGVERIEMWKRVEGFMDADPRVIPEARAIPQLSYDEAAELSFYGARVIHSRALDPARDRDIPIYILDMEDLESTGTRISAQPSFGNNPLTAVSCRRGLSVLRAYGRSASGHQHGMAAIAQRLAEAGVNVVNTASAQISLGVLIESRDEQRALQAMRGLPQGMTERTELVSGAALVCVIGHGIGRSRGLVGKLLCAVVRSGVDVEMVCAGASPVACHLTVAESDLETAMRAVYVEFFTADGDGCGQRLCVYGEGSNGHSQPSEAPPRRRIVQM